MGEMVDVVVTSLLKGSRNKWTLLHLKYQRHIIAGHGGGGSGNRKHGADGDDVIIEVPLGTIVKDAETEKVLYEITEHDQEIIIAKGGRGGLGK